MVKPQHRTPESQALLVGPAGVETRNGWAVTAACPGWATVTAFSREVGMGWETSTRSSRLPKDWSTRRRKVKARACGSCEAKVHEPECNGIGSQCDHIVRGDNHELDNLQWLSEPCHKAKTQREAQAAKPSAKRSRERHPGLL